MRAPGAAKSVAKHGDARSSRSRLPIANPTPVLQSAQKPEDVLSRFVLVCLPFVLTLARGTGVVVVGGRERLVDSRIARCRWCFE